MPLHIRTYWTPVHGGRHDGTSGTETSVRMLISAYDLSTFSVGPLSNWNHVISF
jgi:hypothetical protein